MLAGLVMNDIGWIKKSLLFELWTFVLKDLPINRFVFIRWREDHFLVWFVAIESTSLHLRLQVRMANILEMKSDQRIRWQSSLFLSLSLFLHSISSHCSCYSICDQETTYNFSMVWINNVLTMAESKIINISDILGTWGPWQTNIFIFYFTSLAFSVFDKLSMPFFAPPIDYWCSEPLIYQVSDFFSSSFFFTRKIIL